jgi:hypothetical protein
LMFLCRMILADQNGSDRDRKVQSRVFTCRGLDALGHGLDSISPRRYMHVLGTNDTTAIQ